MMTVLVDLNVALDFFLNRSPWATEAAGVMQVHKDQLIRASISAAALPTLFYVMRRQASRDRAFQAIDECLQTLHIVGVDRDTAVLARSFGGKDFEDDLQIACAVAAGLEVIVSRDRAGFVHSPILVLSPAELLERLSAQRPPSSLPPVQG